MQQWARRWARAAERALPSSLTLTLRRRWRTAERRRFLRSSPSIRDACATVMTWGQSPSDDPIFVLAAGWRSGSTLAQRMITEAGALVWGEPYGLTGPVQSLASILAHAFAAPTPPVSFVEAATRRAQPLWLREHPNLYPSLEDLVDAHRAWFRRLFADPATRLGFDRWGLRETRLSVEHARYFRALFPHARLVFLYRNPYDSWASLRRNTWIASTPDEMITTAADFGRHWKRLVDGFLSDADDLGAHLLSYESLCGDADARAALAKYLGLRFGTEALNHQTWSSQGPLPRRHRSALAKAVAPTATRLGYDGPSAAAANGGTEASSPR